MEQIYYGITAVVYGIFIIRFMLSWIGGDFELDADLDISDVVSFKGLTHFLMGLFGWLSVKSFITHNIQWYDYLIGFSIGLLFVIILYYLYKFMMKLESKPELFSGKGLIGKEGKIYICNKKNPNIYVITVGNNNGTIEVPAKTIACSYTVGESVIIKDFKDGYYLI